MFFKENLLYLTKTRISQSKLAEELDIPRQMINRYVKGQEPNYERLIKISDIFNISIDDLLKKDLSKE